MYNFNNAFDTTVAAYENAIKEAADKMNASANYLQSANGDVQVESDLVNHVLLALEFASASEAILKSIGEHKYRHAGLLSMRKKAHRLLTRDHGDHLKYVNSPLQKLVLEQADKMLTEAEKLWAKGDAIGKARRGS